MNNILPPDTDDQIMRDPRELDNVECANCGQEGRDYEMEWDEKWEKYYCDSSCEVEYKAGRAEYLYESD